MKIKINLCLVIVLFYCCAQLSAQTNLEKEVSTPINLSGPRIGCTYLGSVYTNKLNNSEEFDRMFGGTTLHPFITQFGWQFETRFFTMPNGSCGVIEFVPLIGALDQNIIIPSLSILIGARLANGIEFGMGPVLNLTGSSVSVVLGKNFDAWGINFPVNLAVTPSPSGVRTTVVLGFNKREMVYQ
ncbi:MAG: hypothetical protein ACHQFW_07035 [Chitinophagales bacterium]